MSKGKSHHVKSKGKNLSCEERLQLALSLHAGAKREDLQRPIEDLGLNENTLNALKGGKVEIVADLASRSYSQMFRIQNIGRKHCVEISGALKKLGLDFAKEEEKTNNKEVANNDVAGKERRNDGRPADKNKVGEKNINKKDRPDRSDRNRHDKDERADRRDRDNDRRDRNAEKLERREDKKKNNKGENAQLNNFLSRQYAGMTINEILIGRRQRPAVEKIERPPLTETSLVKFCRKGKWGYKDWKGNVIIPPQYDEAFGFFEERGCVEKEGKLGYIDRKNNLVIDYKYDCATSFSEGLASVTVGEKSGYIDVDGNLVVDFIYDVATPFFDGKAIVRVDDRWGVLSRENLSVFWR